MSDQERHLKGSWLKKLASVHARPVKLVTIEVGRLQGERFALRWVPSEAQREATDGARKWMLERGWAPEDLYSGHGANALEFESRVRLLARALVVPDATDQLACGSPDELRQLLDADEINYLYEQYDAFALERNPWRHWRSAAEFEADVDAYVKGLMPPSWLLSFESASLRSIVTFMGSRLLARTKDSSSATSSQSDSGSASTSSDEPDTTSDSP